MLYFFWFVFLIVVVFVFFLSFYFADLAVWIWHFLTTIYTNNTIVSDLSNRYKIRKYDYIKHYNDQRHEQVNCQIFGTIRSFFRTKKMLNERHYVQTHNQNNTRGPGATSLTWVILANISPMNTCNVTFLHCH
jgi:hypothetical protein